MEQENESEPLTVPYSRSSRPQFNFFYGSTTTGTTPPASLHSDEQDSLVGEGLVNTDNECDIHTTDDDATYQRHLIIDVNSMKQQTKPVKTVPPASASTYSFSSRSPKMIATLIIGTVATLLVFLNPPRQTDVALLSQSFDMPFPKVDRADFGDPVESFMNMDLFSQHLLRQGSNAAISAKSDGDNDRTQPSRSFSFPFPTGAFWTNLVVDPPQGSEMSYPIVVYPFAYRWSSSSLKVSYPAAHRVTDMKSVRDSFIPELTLSTREDITRRQIVDYDPLSVTLEFLSSSSPNSKWETSLVQGNPYITLAYTKQTPVFKPRSIFSDVQCPGDDDEDFTDLIGDNVDDGRRSLFGVCSMDFVFKTPEGVSWFMFASEPMNIVFDTITMTTISTTAPITGVIRLAYIPETGGGKSVSTSTGVKRLIYHSDVYPVGGDVSYELHRSGSSSSSASSRAENPVDAAKSNAAVTFRFETRSMLTNTVTPQTSKNLLMLALPHHVEVISESDILDGVKFDVNYECIKGPMTPVVGSSWTFDEPLYDMEFDAPIQTVDENIKEFILQQVEDDLNKVLPNAEENIYGYGKQVARLAQLAHIADELETKNEKDGDSTAGDEETTVLSKATMQLSKYLEKFLSSDVSDSLVFDANIGGLCSKQGLLDTGEDFGNGRYNDHHFHYGYFLYASAVMARIDPTFIDRFGSYVDAMFHDIAYSSNGSSRGNERDSIFFPMSRHKSWFDGHSFATGLFPFANGKSQESSSEAINCYYGAYLWSLIRHEEIASEVTDFTRLLLSSEIRSTQYYWHMIPPNVTSDNSVFHPHLYPSTIEKNYMIGNVGMLDVNVNTWFGDDPLYVHMINAIPITAVTNLLFGADYVKYEYPFLMSGRGEVEMAWRGYTASIHSIIDPNKAWEDANGLVSQQLDSALSKSQVLYFISQRPGFNITLDHTQSSDSKNRDSRSPSESRSSSESSCESNPGCAELNLTGECCPTSSGIFLGCCNS
eukprot:jgi/Psemu1/65414/estExt_Genemark1.C_1250008